MRQLAGAALMLLLWALPVLAALAMLLPGAIDGEAWAALLQHPQLWPALALSLFTGSVSALLALLCTLIIAAGFYRSRYWAMLQQVAAAGLALPHLAFAIGFGFLIMPSGLMARILVGGEQPPQWVTTQDPLGLSLVAALVLKEVPFLFAMAWSVLSKGDAAGHLLGQSRAAASLGHGRGSIWLRIVQPQLLKRMAWPLVIVFIYGASAVDMALVIGPTQPPTLAVVVWQDLNDADLAHNARGVAGAMFLTIMLAAVLLLSFSFIALSKRARARFRSAGPSRLGLPKRLAFSLAAMIIAVTLGVTLLLVLMSSAPRWPWPVLLPPNHSLAAWETFHHASAPLWASLGLSLATSLTALALTVAWFETRPPQHDRWLLGLALAALALPQILIVAGQYRLFLLAGLSGTWAGLFLAHLTPVVAYVAIVLAGPYRAFDIRFAKVAQSLKAGPFRMWRLVKAPLLKGPLVMAAAVGFGVSMVQYVPAQMIAAGRIQTLPVEAVTLASGGNRALTAVYALMLALPPLIAFSLAALAGRPRWR